MPRGLPAEDWAARHTLVCRVLTAHLPALAGYAWHLDAALDQVLAAEAPAFLLLLIALSPAAGRVRTLAAGAGLLATSLALAQLTGGNWQFVAHYAVVAALVTVYEDWTLYLLAVAAVPAAQVVLELPDAVRPVGPTWLLAGYIVALAAVQLVVWRHGQQSRQRAAHYRAQLDQGQHSLMARIEDTDRIRTELVAVVGHEFRTPLTVLRAALSTLRSHHDRLAPDKVAELVEGAYASAARLHRLLENMLTAATATTVDVDADAVSDLTAVLSETTDALRASKPARADSVTVHSPPHLPVRMTRTALRQLVANLLDNAVTHSTPGAPIRLTAGRVGDEVVLRVRNPGPDLDPETIDELFEPFSQHDSSPTRTADGAGLGLYVVRRLVAVHGGRLRMASDNGEIVVEVDLGAAPDIAVSQPAADFARPLATNEAADAATTTAVI